MIDIIVTELYIYPIKSCRGHMVDRALVTTRGLQDDRLLMIVDGGGHFLTQREYPRMALIEPTLGDELLTLRAPGMATLDLPIRTSGPHSDAVIWNDRCQTIDQGETVAEWLRDYLGTAARLVRLLDTFHRLVDSRYARTAADETNFADGYPFLLISQASLDDLNQRLVTALPMNRFRPNIVVAGCEPFAEDGWRQLEIGTATFYPVKPCARCPIPTVDQATGTIGKEPLTTLAKFRRTTDGKVIFGQNLLSSGSGVINVGDQVTLADVNIVRQ